ncbi:hypothetical protein C7S20_15860 [Christiangramia fulva]|uniref:Cytochrome-c oxidase n=1 Tax=Christiangramia fulva TaxID=2126553 RepID=A0A2R3Z8L7_9FLAO|nr:hypothetical protein [Christiangramia fulva]AVR46618.1 hypothetical protein C7S20_15860 [Christiangramia fulva]
MSDSEKFKPDPIELPEPTIWPFFLALGVTFLLWGILTSMLISAIGLIVFIIALGGWMSDLYHELKKPEEDEL